MSGGGSAAPAVSRTEIPKWVEEPMRENIEIAGRLADRPFEQFPGQTVAPLSAMQQQAAGYGQEAIGYALPAFAQAQQTAAGLTGYRPERIRAPSFLGGNIGAYMSPYTQRVADVAQENLRRQTQQQLSGIGAQAHAARAFGGSRQALQEGVTRAEAARAAGEMSANLQNQAFQQAAALQQSDQARAMQAQQSNQMAGLQGAQQRMQAASGLAELGAGGQRSIAQDVSTLGQLGAQQQQQQQAQMQDQYGRWQAAWQYPQQMLALRQGALQGFQPPSTKTATEQQYQSNPFLSGLGGAASLAGLGPLGAVAGGLLGAVGAFR